jgi:histidinol-phosphate aminotransferase
VTLTTQEQKEFLKRGFTRRNLGKIAAMVTAGASLPFYNEAALAQSSRVFNVPEGSVMINSNENPLGPSEEARNAVHAIVAQGGRYLFGETDKVQNLLAQQEGVKSNYVRIYPGSSAPLHQSVLAFTSPDKPLVMGNPGYESGSSAASFIGAKTIRVPLTSDYRHDVKAMLEQGGPNAGLFYICNPNNPTGTLTPKSEIEWLVANKPKGSIVMVDEAYTHLSEAPFNTDLVAQDKDVVVLRTFSKIYGMAGLRAGAAIARPDLLAKLGGFSAGMLPITGMVAATASLQQKDLVPTRRKIIAGVREDTLSFLEKHNVKYIPSVSNCFMIDVKQDGRKFGAAMVQEKVVIGRVWPVWPTYVRVTVGTAEEMKKFQTAFLKVYSA